VIKAKKSVKKWSRDGMQPEQFKEEDFIKRIKSKLLEIVDEVANAGYMTDTEYKMNVDAIKNSDTIILTMSLKKPEKRVCRECGEIHGEYRSPQKALRIATDISMPGECRMAAQLYIEKKLEEKK